MRNKIHINITSLYIAILGKDILKAQQRYNILKTNKNLALLQLSTALFISIRNIYTGDFE